MVSSASSRPDARPAQGRQVNALQALGLFVAFIAMATVAGVLAAGLVMPAVAGTSVVTDTSVRLFDDLPDELQEVPLSEKSTLLAADGTVLAEFFNEDRIIVPLEEMSEHIINAVVATEDRRFWEHGGIDPQGMGRALATNLASGGVEEGASTLTQQYVKNALIEAAGLLEDEQERYAAISAAQEADGVEGLTRKLQEAKIAISLEKQLTKEEILERYLNIAAFGTNRYGVEAAAQHYFSIPASELNYLQAATIAGITQRPNGFDPTVNPERSQQRRNEVLDRMYREGHITAEERTEGRETPLEDYLDVTPDRRTCAAANVVGNAGFFCDYVSKVIINDETFGETRAERVSRLYAGGLTIYTTLDPDLQKIADKEVKAGIPVDDPSGVGSAISVVEPGTGKILAMAQNRIYNGAQNSAAGETAVNYNTDSAYGSSTGFAPGSTFKVFTLVQWLKEGRSLNETIDARRMEYTFDEFDASCTHLDPRTVYRFGNAEGPAGVMNVTQATQRSVNSAYMRMASEIDLCGMIDTATSLGIHTAAGEKWDVLPSNVLGSQSVSPLTLAASYAAFAAEGTYCEPVAITRVIDADGEDLEVPSANCREAIDPQIANAVTHALSGVWQGTGARVGGLPGRPSVGKTGTTTRNEYTWFAGYTPQMSSVVWVGFPDAMKPVQRMEVGGTWYRNVYGSTIALPTWHRFMSQGHEGLPVERFGQINDRLLHGEQIRVPNVAGQSVEAATSILTNAGFRVQVGSQTWSNYARGSVARTDPGAGTQVTRSSTITLRPSAGPAPRRSGGNDEGGGRGGEDDGGGNGDDGDESSRGGPRLPALPGFPGENE
ncbi:transglycosylase domain-containing protein [Cellulomonas bogoriensis]|uniref:Carboxypeptidase n=1 Tax=Cellulomonas bogoriensis 69B4 = DSM 16987 TaxID=1386082 RepID=A0A0A0C1M6_9CELL|nr:transglycosylase domain-containing protein [Cellulomonas bogoriensis]KGM13867.1 carboxypeptidase [Cellulomonas bogoriensis 69B4 = DSM 16987]